MSQLTGPVQLFAHDIFSTRAATATPAHDLGAYGETRDGRGFRYCQAGAVDLVAGNVIQAAATVTNHLNLTPSAAAIGATSISITLGATAAAVNLYQFGYLAASTGPGNGYVYRIKSHAVVTASGVMTAFLDTEDGLIVAYTTSSRIDLRQNRYANVIQSPVTTMTGPAVGVAVSIIPASGWGWIQTKGPASALNVGTAGAGVSVGPPTTSAGAMAVNTSTNQIIGTMLDAGVDAKNSFVFLTID